MEQIYFLRDTPAGRAMHYIYGNYCYSGPVSDLPPLEGLGSLPAVLMQLQAIQGSIPFKCETPNLDAGSDEGRALAVVRQAQEFVMAELGDLEGLLGEAAEKEPWLAAELEQDHSALYFDFEMRPTANMEDCAVAFAKAFRGTVMSTAIFFEGHVYVSLTEASGEEQQLVDTLFPAIYGNRRGVNLKSAEYEGNPSFARLTLWEASDPVPDPTAEAADDFAAAIAETVAAADTAGGDDDDDLNGAVAAAATVASPAPGLSDLSFKGYNQVYLVMRPQPGSTSRQALFRFGDWVYSGEVDFGVPELHLGDVPDVLPALQRQQGRLAFVCEAGSFPTSHAMEPVLRHYLAAVGYMHDEMVAAEPVLERMAQEGITSWIDAEWAASFFELQLGLSTPLKDVEVTASKTYFPSGIVLHCILFGSSLYCVLADQGADLPLLDVAFPDVTARCRVAQVKAYQPGEGPPGAETGEAPRARKLSVWEGRRRGVAGVGFGAGAAVEGDFEGVGAAIRDKARQRAMAEVAAAAATRAAMQGRGRSKRVKKGATAAAKAAGGGGKEEEQPAAAPAPAPAPAAAAAAPAAASATAATAGSPLERGMGSPQQRVGGGFGVGARAPHHLKPMGRGGGAAPAMGGGAGGGGLLSKLPALDAGLAKAPWDATGKPLGKL